LTTDPNAQAPNADRRGVLNFPCSGIACAIQLTAEMKDVGGKVKCPTCGAETAVPLPKVGLRRKDKKQSIDQGAEQPRGQTQGNSKEPLSAEGKTSQQASPSSRVKNLVPPIIMVVLAGASYLAVSTILGGREPSAEEAVDESEVVQEAVVEEAVEEEASGPVVAGTPAALSPFGERLELLLRRLEAAELTYIEIGQMQVTRDEAETVGMTDTVADIERQIVKLNLRTQDDYSITLRAIDEISIGADMTTDELTSSFAEVEKVAAGTGAVARAERIRKLKDVVVRSREKGEVDEEALSEFWKSQVERSQ
jgi:hypothetical protein